MLSTARIKHNVVDSSVINDLLMMYDDALIVLFEVEHSGAAQNQKLGCGGEQPIWDEAGVAECLKYPSCVLVTTTKLVVKRE